MGVDILGQAKKLQEVQTQEARTSLDGMTQCPCHPNIVTTKESLCSRAYKCDEFGSGNCIAFGEEDYLERYEHYLEQRELAAEAKQAEVETRIQKAVVTFRATCNCIFTPKPDAILCRSCTDVRKIAGLKD